MMQRPDHHESPDPALSAIAAELFPGATFNAVPGSHALVRVATDNGDLVVRRWTPGMPAAHIDVIAGALEAAAAAGVSGTRVWRLVDGQPGYVIERGRERFTVGTWLAGRSLARYGGYRDADQRRIDVPLPRSADALAVVMGATRVVAGVHLASRNIASLEQLPGSSLSDVLARSVAEWTRQRRLIGMQAGVFPDIRRWLRCGNRVLPAARERITEAAGSLHDRSVLLHGDIWPTRMLIDDLDGQRVLTGLTGWTSGLAGSPVLDLAHLAVHSTGWSAANAEQIIGAYTEVAPLRPEERRLIPVVAGLDLVTSVGRLLQLAFVDDRMIGHDVQPVLRSGLKTLLVSLENLASVLAPEDDAPKRRFVPSARERTTRADLPTGSRSPSRPRAPKRGAGRSPRGSVPGTRKTD